jgi:hypothetical protein
MPEEAVMDAPVESAAIETSVDASTDTSTADTATTDAIDSGDTPASGETGHLRGAELYRAVKEKLKASGLTPAEQRSLRNAIHIAAKADEATGGDLNKFTAEREAYQQLYLGEDEKSLPQEEFIQAVRADREQLAGIIADIQSGAPRLVDELFSDHPDSAKMITTQAMDRLAELDNPLFSNYIARSATSYLQNQGVDVKFALIDAFWPSVPNFPGKDQVTEAIKSIFDSLGGLKAIAAKQIPATAKQNPTETGDKTGDLAQREQNLLRNEWNQTAANPNKQLRDSEMTRAAGARKVTLTAQEHTEIRNAVREEFETRLAANPRYGQEMQRFLASGNRREYEKRAKSEGEKLLPSIVARHTNAVIDKRTSTAKPANGTTKPATPAQPVKDTSGNLVQWISGPPKTVGLQVDHNRQRPGMMARGEAYIVGQKAMHRWKVRTASMGAQ